mgnify:FL=1|tara:strand:- start:188 stop:379 length:192 start_codon:yes stop_codon:yes gene_type:complete
MSRSVFCSSCNKSYYPCPDTKTDAECCANACQTKPTLTPKKQKLGGQVRMKNGGVVPGMYYNA